MYTEENIENIMAIDDTDTKTCRECKKVVLSTAPSVYTIDDLLTEEECNHMIKISKDSMERSLVSDNNNGVLSAARTSKGTWLKHDFDKITYRIGQKVASCVNMPLENAESFQVIYYDVNCEYRNHYDSWDHDGSDKTMRCMRYGGARLVTALVYLNEVEAGGSTYLNRLNLNVLPKRGKLLVFENTYPGTNIKHPLSEHAGMPVIKGEKYAFNLWFKECNSSRLYSEFNPGYYQVNSTKPQTTESVVKTDIQTTTQTEESATQSLYKYTHLNTLNGFTKISVKKDIYNQPSFLTLAECDDIIKECDFTSSTGKYSNCWISKAKTPKLISKIETYTGINSRFFENINVFKYLPNQSHGPFVEAYDITSDSGKKNTEKLGQRIYTFTISLSNQVVCSFNHLNESYSYQKGTLVVYDNIKSNSINIRDNEMFHTLRNNNNVDAYVLNIYVREKDLNGNKLESNVSATLNSSNLLSTNVEVPPQPVSTEPTEDYVETFNQVLTKFASGEVTALWRGLNSFNYAFKGDFEYFKTCVMRLVETRKLLNNTSVFEINGDKNKKCTTLNVENLNKTYTFDEFNPVVVENVLHNDVLRMLKEYYMTTIDHSVFVLGDKQSQRYKAHNEPMSRVIQYEMLPLIEKIVGKPLRPSYTYLSAYIKDSDLPAHTDRADCEYTVSFIVNKPENSRWPIYLHKVKQPVKYKGRYDFTPSKDECFEIDCNAGGLMIFSGIDHIHFRDILPDAFYHVILLHYTSI
jgi:prolyl 4-hydroxylase